MKVAKITLLLFLFLIVSCNKDSGDVYPDPDGMNVSDGDEVTDTGEQKDDDGDFHDKDDDNPDPDTVDDTDEDPDEFPEDVPDPDNPDPDNDDDDEVDDEGYPDDDIPLGVCGNGITEKGEECDNGQYNSDEPGKIGVTCRTNCFYAKCGDKIIDNPYEICDDGNNDDGDYCSANCMSLDGSCGDGKIQTNEECDKASVGEGIGGYCSDDCLSIIGSCGDGTKQDHEKCDNAEFGDGIGPYYCSSDCKEIIGSCGDGILQDSEDCDDGENNGRYGYCAADCLGLAKHCGDGVKDIGYEACDDGNNEDNDYCSADCQTELGRCGDGVVQSNEQCDKAIFGAGIGAYCSDDCQTVLGECGDETVQDNEECDWGYANGSPFCEYGIEESCTTCNSVCNFVPGQPTFCGDGNIDSQNGEACDNATPDVGEGEGIGAYCSFDCKEIVGYCGDGAVQSNEVCDKATFYDGIGPEYCSDDCKSIIAYCGDGTIQSTMEECDNGENNTDSCQYGETECTVCSSECKTINGSLSYCGDGRVDPDHEFCDSGSNNGEYKSEYPGYCDTGCQGIGSGGYCGDGTRQDTYEECDEGEDNGASECEYGTETCTVCTPGCETASAVGKYCGDGSITNGEFCDDGEDNGTPGHCKDDCSGMGPGCGNGELDGTEFCDDGENNGTYGYCNVQCTAILECGDGIKQSVEACDDGADNGVYKLEAPGNCNTDCQGVGDAGYCGNSIVESANEECDHSGLIATDCEYGETECTVCDSECKEQAGNVAYCGDGITQTSYGETCDDGENNGTYGYCASDCKSDGEYCGDGVKNGTEDCDDGENNGTYGYCKSDCSGMGPYCGDDIQNGTEICDDGADNGNYGFCKSDCTGLGERCGDGVLQSGEGEDCDDGVNNGTYGYCKSDCSGIGPYCGDGEVTDGESCDDGANNGNYGFCNTECSGLGVHCGDGVLQSGEGEDCDDGVNNGTYGYCKSDCSGIGPYCGDGDVTDGETCDDGTENGGYNKCNETCDGSGPHCGDGELQSLEEICDDGANNGSYGYCASDCSGPGLRCGDGQVTDGEACDDGILNGTDGYCKEDCTGQVEYCGDGIENGTEECDNGEDNGNTYCDYGEMSCNVCTGSCTIVAGFPKYCGDGVTQSSDGEVCDDAADNGTYGYCASDCKSQIGCGDGIQNGTEGCDDGDNNGLYGYCKSDCTGMGPHCGDGDITDGEICDDGENNGSPGYCNSICTEIIVNCGDGVTSGLEICDDGENNGDPGFCNSECSGPTEYCGDGIIQTGETCDDGENNGEYNSSGGPFCDSDCLGVGEGGYCGDDVVQGLYEECDDGGDNGPEGACSKSCILNPYCGDMTVDEDEFCDTADVHCGDFPQFSSGTVPCPADCSVPDFSSCVEDPAYSSPFFTTSQTECFDNSGVISCPMQGSPFYGQEPQFSYQTQSFSVDTDTISESVSGLMWQKDTPATYSGCTAGDPIGSQCSFGEADAFCQNLELDGKSDWRMPTASEFTNIINYSEIGPLIFNDFSNSVDDNYHVTGYSVYLFDINDGSNNVSDKISVGYVKCVSGDSKFTNNDIISKDDLYVNILDSDSNLAVFWQYDSTQTAVPWENALNYCENITENGLSGFRLPTVTELQWFVFESLYNDPKVAETGVFWTSTTFNADTTNAYVVDFSNGNVSYTDKTGTALVICVK